MRWLVAQASAYRLVAQVSARRRIPPHSRTTTPLRQARHLHAGWLHRSPHAAASPNTHMSVMRHHSIPLLLCVRHAICMHLGSLVSTRHRIPQHSRVSDAHHDGRCRVQAGRQPPYCFPIAVCDRGRVACHLVAQPAGGKHRHSWHLACDRDAPTHALHHTPKHCNSGL